MDDSEEELFRLSDKEFFRRQDEELSHLHQRLARKMATERQEGLAAGDLDEDPPGRLTLLHDAVEKLDPYLTVDDWRSIEQSLLELLWHFADSKIDKTKDGKIIPKTNHRRHHLNLYKEKARRLVAQAIDNGVLKRPRECDQCGRGGMIHGHHEDYSKPLDVIWLCVSCHAKEHSGDKFLVKMLLNSKPIPRWSEK
jgi:hypothetical protein